MSDPASLLYSGGMFRTLILSLSISGAVAIAPGHATTQDEVVQARLLDGWRTDRGSVMMGIGLTLTPGWKTYWRSPGDAGIPPQFEWVGSENIGEVRIHWPRPAVFLTNGMTSIGYHDAVVLPVEIFPADPGQDTRVMLRLDLGVCKDICLPASLDLSGVVAATGADSPALKAALAARPVSGDRAGLARIACDIVPIADGLRVTAHMDLPALGGDETVIFEPGLPGVWVSQAETQRLGDSLTATVDMVGPSGVPFALQRSGIVLTIVAGDAAVEVQGCPSGS